MACDVCNVVMNSKANLCANCGARMVQRLEKQQARALRNVEIAAMDIEDYVIEWEEELVDDEDEDMELLEQTLDVKLQELQERRHAERNAQVNCWRRNIQLEMVKFLQKSQFVKEYAKDMSFHG